MKAIQLKKYFKNKKLLISTLFILVFLTSFLSILPTQILGVIIDVFPDKNLTGYKAFIFQICQNSIAGCIIAFVILLVLGNILQNIYGHYVMKLNTNIIHEFRKDAIVWAMYQKPNNKIKTGDIISRITADVEAVTRIIAGPLNGLLRNIIVLIISVIIFSLWNIGITIFVLLTVPFIYVFSVNIAKEGEQIALDIRNETGILSNQILEDLNNILIIQNHNQFKNEINILTSISSKIKEKNIQLSKRFTIYWTKVYLIENFGIAICLIFWLYLVNRNRMTVGDLMILYTYIQNIYQPIISLSRFVNDILQANSSIKRVFELEENFSPEMKKIYSKENRKTITNFSELEIKDLSIKRNDKTLIQNFSLKIKKGEIVLIYGESGSGKSTLLSSLLNSENISSGSIFVNGIDKTNDIQSIDLCTMLYQDNYLFKRTLDENLFYGYENNYENKTFFSYRSILQIDKISQNQDFSYSGGEERRISIFRAIIQNKPVLLLDEPTNGLDKENVNFLIQILQTLKDKKTCIIATHDSRLKSIADQVIYLNDKLN